MCKGVVIGAPHFEPVKLYHDVKILRAQCESFLGSLSSTAFLCEQWQHRCQHARRGTHFHGANLLFSFHASCSPPDACFLHEFW